MPVTISAKGNDFTSWRAAGDFAVTFREALLNRTATLLSDQSEKLFRDTVSLLEEQALACDTGLAHMRNLVVRAAAAGDPATMKMIMEEFYGVAYDYFAGSRSATAFYRLSGEFYRSVSKAVVAYSKGKMGLLARRLPAVALVALGPCGHNEFSPFCRMQTVLVHGEADASMAEPLRLLGRIMHESFEAAGLQLDEVVTSRNPDWCGSLAQWRERLASGLGQGKAKKLIELLRLADQSLLYDEEGLLPGFRADCLDQLGGSVTAIHNLVGRLHNLSSGIGIMGGIRLERSGPNRGLFRLLDCALLPLSVSVTALSLMKGIDAVDTPQRIRALLVNGWLNVETAERMLEAWHFFSELHLAAEDAIRPQWGSQAHLYLDVLAFSESDQDKLRSCLETTATIQRHTGITFSGWEEQSGC